MSRRTLLQTEVLTADYDAAQCLNLFFAEEATPPRHAEKPARPVPVVLVFLLCGAEW